MSSETDHSRQRTVAELLAAHGDTGAPGRRRRRREADGPGDGVVAPGPAIGTEPAAGRWTPLPQPDRSILSEPVPSDLPPWEPLPREPLPREPLPRQSVTPRMFTSGPDAVGLSSPVTRGSDRAPGRGADPLGGRPPLDPVRDRATEQMPRIRDRHPVPLDPALTGPIQVARAADSRQGAAAIGLDDGAGHVGGAEVPVPAPVGAQAGRRVRTPAGRDVPDSGPPTQAALSLDLDDRPVGLGDTEVDDADPAGDVEHDDSKPRGSKSGDVEPGDNESVDSKPADVEPRRRSGRGMAESAGQTWAAVLAQWIVGAVAGASLWVGFSFLWNNLTVVATAAALLVIVGLVVGVRSLLRNDDLRTTVFAVLVGLLLTVSPAVLMLLDS